MRRNNHRRNKSARRTLDLAMELRLINDAAHTPLAARAEALAWLRRWKRRPERTFWEVQPTGGQRLL